jgi:hypothetical protein
MGAAASAARLPPRAWAAARRSLGRLALLAHALTVPAPRPSLHARAAWLRGCARRAGRARGGAARQAAQQRPHPALPGHAQPRAVVGSPGRPVARPWLARQRRPAARGRACARRRRRQRRQQRGRRRWRRRRRRRRRRPGGSVRRGERQRRGAGRGRGCCGGAEVGGRGRGADSAGAGGAALAGACTCARVRPAAPARLAEV